MFRSMTSKVCLLFTLVALAALPSVSRASGTGGVTAAGYTNYGTSAQTYVNIGVTDYGALSSPRFAGQIRVYGPAGYLQARPMAITYSGSDTATISYAGLLNGLFLQFGQITVHLSNPTGYQGTLGLNALPTVFTGSVWVVTL
jgi:hypothetical protein